MKHGDTLLLYCSLIFSGFFQPQTDSSWAFPPLTSLYLSNVKAAHHSRCLSSEKATDDDMISAGQQEITLTGAASHSDQSKQEPKSRSVSGWRFGCLCTWVAGEGGSWGCSRLYDPLDENKHVHFGQDDECDVSRSLLEMKHAKPRPRERPPQ